ncbi:hypothetical protein OESDEN_22174 [Oesophagostomum dentatum]|uniref:Uncharacterized protein n=1 Tax=Oesophagostomum dentatum TaxID=61180 RepID=A0A0B1S2V2_OESDE|nr:hypothetical protein OESDEN_22174 [Oesophagostomum dentatum]
MAEANGLKPFTFPMGAVFPGGHGLMNEQDMGPEYGGGKPPTNRKYYAVIVPDGAGQEPEQPVNGQGQPGGGLLNGGGGTGTVSICFGCSSIHSLVS